MTATLRYGERDLDLAFDSQSRGIHFQERDIPWPSATNVLLIDDVDKPRDMRVAGFLSLDAVGSAIDPQVGSLGPAFSRPKDLVTFLQCDRELPNLEWNQLISRIACKGLSSK